MHILRIKKVILKPLLVLSRDRDDAMDIFDTSFGLGMGSCLINDPDLVQWEPDHTGFADPIRRWVERGRRALVWSVDRGLGCEVVCTDLGDP